jgi:hypothetical protein
MADGLLWREKIGAGRPLKVGRRASISWGGVIRVSVRPLIVFRVSSFLRARFRASQVLLSMNGTIACGYRGPLIR